MGWSAGGSRAELSSLGWAGAVAAVILTACTSTGSGTTTSTDEGPVTDYTGSVTLEPVIGRPGDVVTVTGIGSPPNPELPVTASSYEGSWLIEGDAGEEYHGRQFTPTVTTIGAVTTDGSGGLSSEFVVPDDFGFGHDVRLVDQQGIIRNQALFTVGMDVSISPESGPPGTPITIRVS